MSFEVSASRAVCPRAGTRTGSCPNPYRFLFLSRPREAAGRFTWLIFLTSVCLLLAIPAWSLASAFSGLPVTQIQIQDDQGRPWTSPEHITALMVVKPGDSYSGDNIRQGISYLYLTGKFRDVRVEGFPDKDGVKLIYSLVPITIVDSISITGNTALPKSRILETLQGVEGRELREDRFQDYRTGILTLYQAEGYYGTIVSFQIEPLKKANSVLLRVSILEPRRTVIAGIDFSGNSVFTKKQLLKAMKSTSGQPLRTDVLFDEDMQAILEKYTKAGYPAAKPGPVDISFRDEKAYVHVYGKEGPKVTVSFLGNQAFNSRDLEKQILIWVEHDASDAIIDSSADKIKNIYKTAGYHNVKVTAGKTEAPGALDILFDIQEGQRITVKKISISGNTYFTTKQIKADLSLREPGWFSSSAFQQESFDKSVEYLRERYLEAGFLSVVLERNVDFTDEGRKAEIGIAIDEGSQTLVGAVAFEGNAALSEADLLPRMAVKQGSPYNERLVDEDRYRMLSAYAEKGYLYARVEVEKKPASGTIDINYRISEDQPVVLGRIIVRGNDRTRESVIRNELLVEQGAPYSYEKILKSQQRIYRLGYFNQARMEPVRAGRKDYIKDMLFSVEERPAGSVEIGVGYGDLDRARAFVEISHRNVWGLAHYAGIRFEESDILKRSILNYQQPRFFGYDLQGKFALTWSDLKHINSDTREIYYETRQTAASYGIEKKLNGLKASLSYAFENVENYNVTGPLAAEDAGHVRVSSISPSLVWDFRDDIFNPRKGALYGIVAKQAMRQLGSEADFTKASIQGSWYAPITPSVVTAFSARGGLAWPHYETTEIPLHERFYLGGNTTVRGYTQDSLGQLKQGTPTGGSGMAQFNLELRMMPTDGFGFVLFADAGNVWQDQRIFFDDLRASYGLGIRYGTPVGPLRIDYGQKINRQPGESPGELHFNIGHTF